jgi:hypothetical protein
MAHWEYILWAVSGPIGLATWRYAPRAFLMVVGALTKDPQRSHWRSVEDRVASVISGADAKVS